MMSPLRESGAHSSKSSRLGPVCMKPGVARTTHGGPSAILRSHPRGCGKLEICLAIEVQQYMDGLQGRNVLEHKWIVALSKSGADVRVHGVYICLINSHTFAGKV